MSDSDHDFPKTTAKQVILATLGGLIPPLLVIFLVVKLLMGIQASHIPDADPAIESALVAERIKPVATIDLAVVESGPHVDKTGEAVVGAVCSACHAVGALGSPKIGDAAAWGPRIKQGYETLISHAINGIRQMPARGGNPDLTDNEIANAVAYMANKGGASFKAPEAGGAVGGASAPAAAATPAPVAEAPVAQAKPATPAEPKKVAAAPAAKPEATEKPAAPPAASEVVATKEAAPAGKSGEQVYNSVCTMCHSVGLMGAPKFGDKDAWAPRIAQGYDTLVQHALKGIRMMPAKGGNPALSDTEVAGAVAYMANNGGANFK
ncbi:c-type cytochrome [Methyloradius palustris]|uniref:Cytochrome n=1 Tax=Methyloradius palustris TaxID=2778876 RepID=A0A8D5G6P0_9PROT|nr:c-type cytochrome [Methyloradius palustris]BCM24157.1 cytochrome [Methyloradius palustris]